MAGISAFTVGSQDQKIGATMMGYNRFSRWRAGLTFGQRCSVEAAMLLSAVVVGAVWLWVFVCCWMSQ
jgi:hypothetical protein